MTKAEIKVLDRVIAEFRKTLNDLGERHGEVLIAGRCEMDESYQYLTEIYTTAYDIVRGLRDAGVWIYDED